MYVFRPHQCTGLATRSTVAQGAVYGLLRGVMHFKGCTTAILEDMISWRALGITMSEPLPKSILEATTNFEVTFAFKPGVQLVNRTHSLQKCGVASR